MQLPYFLQQKINSLFAGLGKKKLEQKRSELTKKYKEETGRSVSLIDSKDDGLTYAISRMPSTFAVTFTLVSGLVRQGLIQGVETLIDFGSGTGAGYFAFKELDDELDITLVERDQNMISVFKQLDENETTVIKNDILSFESQNKYDLVFSSYVLSEMTESDRKKAFLKLLDCSEKYVLLIDTGTPKTYQDYMQLKELAYENGYSVLAPCLHKNCKLQNDYCQFFARVERSALQKMAKSATLGYEDEKYFYLLLSKNNVEVDGCRVIRRPVIETNMVKLSLCTKDGVEIKTLTKKEKEMFKCAKKSKINDLI